MKVKYPTKPMSRVVKLDAITYGCKLKLSDGTAIEFTLTEMQEITDMWKSFKKQSGFKTLKNRSRK